MPAGLEGSQSEEKAALLGPGLGELQQQPEILTAVLDIVRHLAAVQSQLTQSLQQELPALTSHLISLPCYHLYQVGEDGGEGGAVRAAGVLQVGCQGALHQLGEVLPHVPRPALQQVGGQISQPVCRNILYPSGLALRSVGWLANLLNSLCVVGNGVVLVDCD